MSQKSLGGRACQQSMPSGKGPLPRHTTSHPSCVGLTRQPCLAVMCTMANLIFWKGRNFLFFFLCVLASVCACNAQAVGFKGEPCQPMVEHRRISFRFHYSTPWSETNISHAARPPWSHCCVLFVGWAVSDGSPHTDCTVQPATPPSWSVIAKRHWALLEPR